jgi:hypothetical protein
MGGGSGVCVGRENKVEKCNKGYINIGTDGDYL